MSRILIIEDDPDIAQSLKFYLEREGGYRVGLAHDGEEGLRRSIEDPPDLVLLDLNLPGRDGLEVCRGLRGDLGTQTVPVIMITARIDESEKVAGLDLGADDYITKPFSMKEVLARVRAVLRRSGGGEAEARVLVAGPIVVDEASRSVRVQGREVTLTRKEFDLLAALIRQAGRVLTRERLLERVWGYEFPGETRTVDVHVRQLRKKLGSPSADAIETVVGVGYRFRAAS
jgi:DNA-binding response OmpR family regulator